MPRVKRGLTVHRRHKRILKQTKGQWGARHRLIRTAKEAVMRGLRYAYRDRRQRKRDFRRLWIARVNAAARESGLIYSRFAQGLRQAGVEVDRKMLAELAVNDRKAFDELVAVARARLSG